MAWTLPKEGGYIIDSTIGIAKGTKKREAAEKYINFVLSEQRRPSTRGIPTWCP